MQLADSCAVRFQKSKFGECHPLQALTMNHPSVDHVCIVRNFLLPYVEASRHTAHQLIAYIPTDVLAIRPVAEGDSIGELFWDPSRVVQT